MSSSRSMRSSSRRWESRLGNIQPRGRGSSRLWTRRRGSLDLVRGTTWRARPRRCGAASRSATSDRPPHRAAVAPAPSASTVVTRSVGPGSIDRGSWSRDPATAAAATWRSRRAYTPLLDGDPRRSNMTAPSDPPIRERAQGAEQGGRLETSRPGRNSPISTSSAAERSSARSCLASSIACRQGQLQASARWCAASRPRRGPPPRTRSAARA